MGERRVPRARRRTDRIVQRWGARVALAYLVLLTVFVVAVFDLSERTGRLAHRVNDAIAGSCYRLNVERAVQNRADMASWRLYVLVARLTSTGHNHTRPQSRYFVHLLELGAAGERWTPLTDCHLAVDRPLDYKPPSPRVFFLLPDGGTPPIIAKSMYARRVPRP